MTTDPASELLLKAANYLKTYGWIQGRAGGFNGPACAWGALYEVSEDSDVRYEALQRVELVVGVKPGYLPSWNDEPGRRKDEVIEALERAATS